MTPLSGHYLGNGPITAEERLDYSQALNDISEQRGLKRK